jgi:predicted small metal-binding protein
MTADSVEELIPIVKEHARKEHQYQMTDDEVRASVVHREASND